MCNHAWRLWYDGGNLDRIKGLEMLRCVSRLPTRLSFVLVSLGSSCAEALFLIMMPARNRQTNSYASAGEGVFSFKIEYVLDIPLFLARTAISLRVITDKHLSSSRLDNQKPLH